jgi:hypothetical protein
MDNKLEPKEFMKNLWELKKCRFISLIPLLEETVANYYAHGSYSGMTVANLIVWRWPFATTEAPTFPTNLTNSVGYCEIVPTADTTYIIAKIVAGVTTNLGTMKFSAGQHTATFTLDSPYAPTPNDVFVMIAPATPDLTISGVSWSLWGSL